ncbi:MAG: glycosyltransferase family 4 protein [Cyclobacteriaceae bacterium]|nr:glycosyltransferase family 4 protein [Cyclobacteriaceae bacterium]
MKLVIVSATPMYGIKEGEPLEVYEPTLREIEHISNLFEEVLWLGYYKGINPGNARRPGVSNVRLGAISRAEGGGNFFKKLKIIPQLPLLVFQVFRAIQQNDVIHSRGPSVPAFVCIVLSFLYREKKFWHKYAGNWMEPHPPIMYKVQKRLLIRAVHANVTINGHWPSQPKQVISLENPCFTEGERGKAMDVSKGKGFDKKLILCFAGLIDSSKGVPALLSSFQYLDQPYQYIEKLILAGDGPDMAEVKKLAKSVSVPVEFTGYIQRQSLNEIYRQSHVLLLPSRTEGFPKVVAEAASFGCIPIVTDVSSIGQYVEDGVNGFLLKDGQPTTIAKVIERLTQTKNLPELSQQAKIMSGLFTYERFHSAIAKHVIQKVI